MIQKRKQIGKNSISKSIIPLQRMFSIALFLLFSLTLGVSPAFAATRTWDGGGSTNNWNEAANWSSDAVPGSADYAVFNSTNTKNATINVSINLYEILIDSLYSGTATQNFTLTDTADFDGDITVNKSSGEVNLASALTMQDPHSI